MKRKRFLSVFLSLCMIIMCMAGFSVTAGAINYTITIADGIQNGGVAVQDEAAEGETVDIDVTPEFDCVLYTITVTDADNNDIEVFYPTDDDGPYTFTMPASAVTVNAIFTEKPADIDISAATVTVDTSDKTVTVIIDEEEVPDYDYYIIYYTYEGTETGESLVRAGTNFPQTTGTYIAVAVANDDSGYTGSVRSKPFTVSATGDIDITDGTVFVDTSAKTVKVMVDGVVVSEDDYHVIYFTYAKTEGGESLTRAGTEFPTAPGTYIASIVANEGSGYTGETRSQPFTVAPAYTPIYVPTYTPSSVTTYITAGTSTDAADTTADDAKEETVGEAVTVEDTTDTEENFGGADIDTDLADLEQAVLTDADRQAVKDGGSVNVYLEVKEVEPTADEETLIEEAAEDIGEDITIAAYLDVNLFKQVGSSSAVQIHETNGQIEVSFALPESLENSDPTVERTYYIARIHDGEVDIIPAEYDSETGKLSFLTDRFSTYAIIFVDVALEDDGELSNGEEEVPDLSESIVYVTVESQNVTVRLHGGLVSKENYHVIFFAYEKIEGGESLTRVGTDFPTAPGTYIAAIVANEGSGFFGENRSEPFTIEATEAAAETNPGTGAELPGLAVLAISAAAVSFTAKRKLK